MTSQEILNKFFDFYKARGHKQVPNVSLVPENDPTLLYVNSGMFPLVPYLSGEPHPLGKRIMNVQRCLRFFEDLDNVGLTNRHTTAFHMIGNWSLGDYFKEEQLNNVYTFLFEELKLDPQKTYGSVFVGDEDAPKDVVSIEALKTIFSKYGITAKVGEHIFEYGKKDNWWQRGEAIGELGGPDSEIFYYIGKEGTGLGMNPSDNQDDFIEIGNSVFMQYKKTAKGWGELPQKNVDFGGGLERLAMVAQGKSDIYLSDAFYQIIQAVEQMCGKKYDASFETTKSMRILADHIRSATFLAMDGVLPSNKDQGYILRRLIRLMVRAGRKLDIEKNISVNLVPVVSEMFNWLYPLLKDKQAEIQKIFSEEESRFRTTLQNAARKVEKVLKTLTMEDSAKAAFDAYQSLGYPVEMFKEDLIDKGVLVGDTAAVDFDSAYKKYVEKHQKESRSGAAQKFEGGLADHSEQTIKYHTATHLLHMALRKVLGEDIVQHGSNITGERLRFDFNCKDKLSEEQITEVEKIVNEAIATGYPVKFEMLPKEQALATGAIHAFNEKYADEVKVYYVGNSLDSAISKEFCGGPHLSNTSEIGFLKIFKQEKLGTGLLRLYAV